jgi:hypothetical protein
VTLKHGFELADAQVAPEIVNIVTITTQRSEAILPAAG